MLRMLVMPDAVHGGLDAGNAKMQRMRLHRVIMPGLGLNMLLNASGIPQMSGLKGMDACYVGMLAMQMMHKMLEMLHSRSVGSAGCCRMLWK